MRFSVDYDVEEDGRIIASVPQLPGVHVYGNDKEEARRRAVVLTLQVIADRLEHREPVPDELLPEVVELPFEDSDDG